MTSRRLRESRAFTLVEVLASLALVGIILPVAMAGVSLAMGLGGTAARRTEAVELAHGKLDEMMATGQWRDGNQEGTFADVRRAYTWAVEVAAWEETSVREVKVTVRWTSGGKPMWVSAATLGYWGSE